MRRIVNRVRVLSPIALHQASLAGATMIAATVGGVPGLAEVPVQSGKSDRIVILASLSWQPTSSDGQATFPTSDRSAATRSAAGGTAQVPTDQLRAAFSVFDGDQAKPEPLPGLRTASLEPMALPADKSAADSRGGVADHAPVSVADLPLPRPKPHVPKVRVASLAPTDDIPSEELHKSPIEAAPVLGEPRKIPAGAAAYLDIFRREAKVHDIPLWLALGVAWVESKFDPKLRGSHTVVGMMQVMPSTAREMGYRGTTSQLFDPETNIIWGMHELAKDYQLARGDICLTIAKYKGGFRTNHINKGAWNYCSQVKRVTGMP